jgi:DNA-binding transcriptional regulator LsrR (DeoR family)
MKAIIASVWRAIRVALAIAAGQFLAQLLQQPELVGMGIAPVLSAVFKAVRGAFPKLWWIPL